MATRGTAVSITALMISIKASIDDCILKVFSPHPPSPPVFHITNKTGLIRMKLSVGRNKLLIRKVPGLDLGGKRGRV